MEETTLHLEAQTRHEHRRFVLVCVAIALLSLSLKLPSLFWDRAEDDERIYWALTQNWIHTGEYSLQGTPILPQLSPSVYDKPLFHHPPALPVLLAPFVMADSPHAAIVVSWLGHVMAIGGVAVFCWLWKRRSWTGTHWLLWLPVLAVALDPLFSFCTRKLWPDAILGGFVALGMACVCLATQQRKLTYAVLGGVLLGCAGMVKLPGLIVAPFALLIVILSTGTPPLERRRLLVAVGGPLCLVVLPWFIVFNNHYGVLIPDWIRPDAPQIAASTHVARGMARPWHYLLTEPILVAPIVLVVIVGCCLRRSQVFSRPLAIPVAWAVLAWSVLMFLKSQGHVMQLRFLTVASPAVYVALAVLLRSSHARRSFLPLVSLLVIILAIVNVGFYLTVAPQFDEIVSLPELVWRMARGPQG